MGIAESVFKSTLKRLLQFSDRGIILAGHGVAKTFVNRKTELVHISFEDFRSTILLLEDLGFEFLTMEDVRSIARGGARRCKPWVHLTFDDGYQNIFDVAYPFLAERQIPFSLFVSTFHIESGDRFPTFWFRLAEELEVPLGSMFPEYPIGKDAAQDLFETAVHFAAFSEHKRIAEKVKSSVLAAHGEKVLERYYNDSPLLLRDLKSMSADPLVHIGSHSHEHIIFHAGQDPDVARNNITESLHLLRRTWKISDEPTFCYPNGDWAPQWARLLEELGVAVAFPDVKGFVEPGVDPMLMPRFWLTNPRRMLAVGAMSLLGNASLYAVGRKPPPRLN